MIFKINLLAALLLTVSFSTYSQGKSKTPVSAPAENKQVKNDIHTKVYELAMKYNDLPVAREALYHLLALHPERTGIKDTLTYLYYNTSNYVQVILIGKEILESKPDKADILELVAVSQQNLGMLKEALESFEKLYALTKDIYHQYNLASLQYMLKRYGECSENLNAIISSGEGQGEGVTISDAKGEAQQVPIKAAAFNMRGVIALEINQSDVARQNFEKALELFPDFSLAKANLQKISQTQQPEKKK